MFIMFEIRINSSFTPLFGEPKRLLATTRFFVNLLDRDSIFNLHQIIRAILKNNHFIQLNFAISLFFTNRCETYRLLQRLQRSVGYHTKHSLFGIARKVLQLVDHFVVPKFVMRFRVHHVFIVAIESLISPIALSSPLPYSSKPHFEPCLIFNSHIHISNINIALTCKENLKAIPFAICQKMLCEDLPFQSILHKTDQLTCVL
jgi:hypothetical protein